METSRVKLTALHIVQLKNYSHVEQKSISLSILLCHARLFNASFSKEATNNDVKILRHTFGDLVWKFPEQDQSAAEAETEKTAASAVLVAALVPLSPV